MTTLTIYTPEVSEELEWVSSIIFSGYLGIDYVIEISAERNFSINCDHRILELPNIFFISASSGLLDQSHLPKTPLDVWDSQACCQNMNLVDSLIPIIYGTAEKP